MSRNPIARNMHKANKSGVIPDKKRKMLEAELEKNLEENIKEALEEKQRTIDEILNKLF